MKSKEDFRESFYSSQMINNIIKRLKKEVRRKYHPKKVIFLKNSGRSSTWGIDFQRGELILGFTDPNTGTIDSISTRIYRIRLSID